MMFGGNGCWLLSGFKGSTLKRMPRVHFFLLDKRADFSKSSTTHYSAHDSGGFFPSVSILRTLFVLGLGMFSMDILFCLCRTYAFIYP